MDSFRPKIIRVDVQKKPGHLKDSVLSVDGEDEAEDGPDGGKPGEGPSLKKMWNMVGR